MRSRDLGRVKEHSPLVQDLYFCTPISSNMYTCKLPSRPDVHYSTMLGSRLTALLLVVPEIMKNPEGIFRVFRKPFFCKTISRIFHYEFFGQVARGTFKNRFKARGGARLPARPMHRGDRVAMARPTVHHMPRRAPAPPRGGLLGKHVSWNHCPKSPPGFPGDLLPGKSSPKFGSKFRAMAPRKRRFFRVFGKSGCLKGAREGP